MTTKQQAYRERQAAAGRRQLAVWVTDAEAVAVRRFLVELRRRAGDEPAEAAGGRPRRRLSLPRR